MVNKKSNENSKKKEQELQKYIETMISRGFSESAIIKGLKKKGWSLTVIKRAIRLAKLNREKEKAKVVHEKKVEKKVDKKEKAEVKVKDKKDNVSSKSTKMQLFFFIIFLASLGLSVYTYIKGMWIAMGLVLLLLVISLLGYKLKSRRGVIDEGSSGEVGEEGEYAVRKKYKEALKAKKLRGRNLREIMKKKHEEERYLKKIEKIKKREERLKVKQETKANSKGGKAGEKLKKIEKKTERLKQVETKLESELEMIGQKKEFLEHGKTLSSVSKDETDLDLLYDFIQKYGKIRLHEIVIMFGIPKKVATQWMNILEEYELAEIYYPIMGSPEIKRCKK